MRYNPVERLGVIATELIITEDLNWIFREQPILDVGIDGLVEECIDQNPTGKFLAVQIKSGKGNFHITDTHFTHYISNIHYHYWLNMDLPIILIAYIPETKQTYWEHINKKNLKRARKRWKLEISKKQLLNSRSKSKLTSIIRTNYNNRRMLDLIKGNVRENTFYDLVEDIECISDSADSVIKIAEIITELNERVKSFNIKINQFNLKGLNLKSPEVIAGMKGFAKDLAIVSTRLKGELDIFTELYSIGLLAFEQLAILSIKLSQRTEEFESALTHFTNLPESIEYASNGINSMRSSISKLPTKNTGLKKSKNLLLEVIDIVAYEFDVSKNMTSHLVSRLNEF